jgi:pyrroloquinoline quinone biosynthesis protein B
MIEATPDFKDQWQVLSQTSRLEPKGILITHAHAGHYTGLIQLGKEMMNAQKMPVVVLPRMATYLRNNGPWSQLVSQQNIEIHSIVPDSIYRLSKNLSYQALLVPHRDEYSETAAFIIHGPTKKLLFVPDIDKWNKWRINILTLIKEVDYALIDGTFFKNGELKNRDMSEIPHPFVTESLDLFRQLDLSDRNKIHFIHFNHTNPLVYDDPAALEIVVDTGMNIAREGLILGL